MTRPETFEEFHSRLLQGAPPEFSPTYIPVEAGSKHPADVDSQSFGPEDVREAYAGTGRCLGYHEAKRRLEAGKNVGVATFSDQPLLILDIDWHEGDEFIMDHLPETLKVMSKSRRGHHLYVYLRGPVAATFERRIDDFHSAGGPSVKWDGGYVVAPGSYVPSQAPASSETARSDECGYYTIETDRPPAQVRDLDAFPPAFRQDVRKQYVKNAILESAVATRLWTTLSHSGTLRRTGLETLNALVRMETAVKEQFG